MSVGRREEARAVAVPATAVGIRPNTCRFSSATVMCRSRAMSAGVVPYARSAWKTAASSGDVSRVIPPGSLVR